MPEYILHTVQKGDTLWGISKKYKVEEHKIVQANPEKIKLQKRGSKYTPVIYEGDVLRIPQDTEETVSYKIEGKASLGMGESTEYQLLDSEGNIPHYPSEKISWQFHVDEGSENWRQLRLAKEKTGQKFTIVFTNQKLKAKKIRIEAYFKGQDSTSKLAKFLMVLDGEDTAEIKKLELLDANRNLIKRKLSYAETLFARAQCTGMEGETLYFSLWEDDAPGAGHSKENEENFIATKQAQVVNGRAEVSFSLIYSTMAPIANRKIPAGQKDEGPYHEYYVTVTRYEATEPEKSSKNVDVNNPDYVPLPPKPKPKKKETPKTKPQAQPKKKEVQETVVYGKSRTTNHAKITSIQITDILNNDINRDLSSGESVRIHINTQQCKGEKLRIDVYDNFVYANNKLRFNPSDLIGSNEILVQQDNFYFDFPLLRFVYNPGRDLWVVVTLYKTNQTVTTTTITVDKTDFSVPKPEGINPVTKQAPMQKGEDKEGKCPNCEKDITAEELKQIFPSATEANRKIVADTYNKHMKELGMNTCWNKAHFFAQAKVESGDALSLKEGEGFNYYWESLIGTFKAFQSKEGREKAKIWGRAIRDRKDPKAIDVPKETQIKIANYAYSPPAAKAKELGNTEPNDGWDYRGRGLIQVTGKSFYQYCNQYTVKYSNIDVLKNPDSIGERLDLCVSSGMIFFKWKKINELVNKTRDVKNKICPLVGNDIIRNGVSKNHQPKQDAFDNITSKVFKIDKCYINSEDKKKLDNGKCLDDCSQCFEYADVWDNPEISNDNGGKNNNRYGFNSTRGHKGIDILSGPTYKDVHSIMCGEVVSLVNSFKTNEYRKSSLGNTLMIKSKTKEGKIVFILYCHLDKIYVKKGDRIKHGQKVALSGSTGNASFSDLPNGVKGHGIDKKYWHCHIEAATKGEGYNNFYNLGSFRIKAEDYMKTKFDKDGNAIK